MATAERTYTLTATDTDGDAATLAFTIRVVNHPVVSEVRIMDWGTNGVYYSGEEIRIFVGFSSSITVWGNTDLAIVIGGQTRRARRHSFNTTGSGTRTRYRTRISTPTASASRPTRIA